MESPTASSSSPLRTSIPVDQLAAAAERRQKELSQSAQPSAAQLAEEHDRRQCFRRLIDPGIIRPNPKEQALASLKVSPLPALAFASFKLNATLYIDIANHI